MKTSMGFGFRLNKDMIMYLHFEGLIDDHFDFGSEGEQHLPFFIVVLGNDGAAGNKRGKENRNAFHGVYILHRERR